MKNKNENVYPKVLIVSDATWGDNNIGDTFNNIFGEWPSNKLAMIYARSDIPKTDICEKFFQISENRLIENFFNSDVRPGLDISNLILKEASENSILTKSESSGKKLYDFFKSYRLNSFLTIREMLWKVGKWQTKELNNFITEFNPNIILGLATSSVYLNNIYKYVVDVSESKGFFYFVDDVYSNTKFSVSPIFWINRFFIRKKLRESVKNSERFFCIIPKQQKEYDMYFKRKSLLLNKGGDFNKRPKSIVNYTKPIKLVFTGNIIYGRWKTLSYIGEALDFINKDKLFGEIYIYTQNTLSKKIEKKFSEIKSLNFMGEISPKEVKNVQKKADILVHVESFKIKERLETRLSFSTKIVDYLENGKCILAVGPKESASIEYLEDNDSAIVIKDINKIKNRLLYIFENESIISKYSKKSFELGKKNHDLSKIRLEFLEVLISIL